VEAPLSDTVSGHHFQRRKLELIEELALIKMLEQPATEKAKEAEALIDVQVQRLQRQEHRRNRQWSQHQEELEVLQ
jgi:hypothetical protein